MTKPEKMSIETIDWIKRGKAFKRYRLETLELSLREAAKRWNMLASDLIAIERGEVLTKWTPPGWTGNEDCKYLKITNYDAPYQHMVCSQCKQPALMEYWEWSGIAEDKLQCPHCFAVVDIGKWIDDVPENLKQSSNHEEKRK